MAEGLRGAGVNVYTTDTHALLWYLQASPKLGPAAIAAFQEAERGEAVIKIPVIVLAELYYANQKLGRPLDFKTELAKLRRIRKFHFVPFFSTDIADFDNATAVPEMHDRIIVNVALRFGGPCITRDSEIIASGLVPIVW
jgi:PIN domain nuclease of toxin-antitoxin system